jgi:hypothetical protein
MADTGVERAGGKLGHDHERDLSAATFLDRGETF